jgi:hypothetical protein
MNIGYIDTNIDVSTYRAHARPGSAVGLGLGLNSWGFPNLRPGHSVKERLGIPELKNAHGFPVECLGIPESNTWGFRHEMPRQARSTDLGIPSRHALRFPN